MNIKEKIQQMLALSDEVLEQAYNILYGEGTNYAHKSEHIRNLLTMNRALLATLPSVYEMLNFLESHLPKQEQDLEKVYSEHCEPVADGEVVIDFLMTLDGFKRAVAELQEPKFPSYEQINAKIEEIIKNQDNFIDSAFDGTDCYCPAITAETLTNFAKWLKGGKNG